MRSGSWLPQAPLTRLLGGLLVLESEAHRRDSSGYLRHLGLVGWIPLLQEVHRLSYPSTPVLAETDESVGETVRHSPTGQPRQPPLLWLLKPTAGALVSSVRGRPGWLLVTRGWLPWGFLERQEKSEEIDADFLLLPRLARYRGQARHSFHRCRVFYFAEHFVVDAVLHLSLGWVLDLEVEVRREPGQETHVGGEIRSGHSAKHSRQIC